MSEKLKVTFYQRKARRYNNFSIENYFNAVRSGLTDQVLPKVSISKYESNGILKRLYNSFEAIPRQGDINHVTGDVHYLTSFLYKRKTLLTVMDCGQLKVLKGVKLKLFRYFWFRLPAARSNCV